MKSDLGDVLTALDLSTKTFRRIRLNYLWAFGYNCLMIPLAAGALFPPTRWQMPPWVAGAHRRLAATVVAGISMRGGPKVLSCEAQLPEPPAVDRLRWQQALGLISAMICSPLLSPIDLPQPQPAWWPHSRLSF